MSSHTIIFLVFHQWTGQLVDMNILVIRSLSTFFVFFALHCWWAATVQEISAKTKRRKKRHHNQRSLSIQITVSFIWLLSKEKLFNLTNERKISRFLFVLLMEYLLSKLIYLSRLFLGINQYIAMGF
jgi:hypothetical protein